MSKKHRRSKKKTKVINQSNNITPVISKKIEKKDATSLQELINNNSINNETIKIKRQKTNSNNNPKTNIIKEDQQLEVLTKINEDSKEKKTKQITTEEKTQKQTKETEKQNQKLTNNQKEIIEPSKEEIIIVPKKEISKEQIDEESSQKEPQITQKKEHTSKTSLVIIFVLTIILTGLIIFLTYFSINYYKLINDNNELLQKITITNNEITNTENNNQIITNKITETEKILKEKIKEYNIWLKLKETIEKTLS